jgi:hypothetical protein
VRFEVLDILDGFTTLAKRSQTLGGSVPLRVAQACVPLLEGNAHGHQLAISKRLELVRRLGRWSVARFEGGDELARLLRGGSPMLRGIPAPEAVVNGGRTIALFTGLYARTPAGTRLRISTAANRRSYAYEIEEIVIEATAAWTPIVLTIVPNPEVDRIILDGEVATIAMLPSRVTIARRSMAEGADIVKAHVGFYEAEYFATKQAGEVARKYRDELRRASETSCERRDDVEVTVVDSGPIVVEVARHSLIIKNAVAFEAIFDGSNLAIEPDRDQLSEYAEGVRAEWRDTVSHPGALLYLTKYFTPHPRGEPHFFTKPCVLVKTSPGASTVIEGRNGSGYDIMRGVVRTDTFHATPSVFHLWQPGRRIEVPRGEVLAELFPAPRHLLDATFELHRGGACADVWSRS